MRIHDLKPWRLIRRCTDFPPESAAPMGIRLVLLDLDNTLEPPGARVPSPETIAWVRALEAAGCRCVLLSNARRDRARSYADALGIPAVLDAGKPGLRGVRRALDLAAATPDETLLFGDQVFTDILAAGRAGIRSFLVAPRHLREWAHIRLKRIPEWVVLRGFGIRFPGKSTGGKDPGSER